MDILANNITSTKLEASNITVNNQDIFEFISERINSANQLGLSVNALSGTVGGIVIKQNEHDTAINKIEGDITTINTATGKIEGDITTINGTISNINGNIAAKADLTAVTDLTNNITTLTNTVNGHTTALNTINENLTSINTSLGTIDTLQTNVNTNVTKIDEISSKMIYKKEVTTAVEKDVVVTEDKKFIATTIEELDTNLLCCWSIQFQPSHLGMENGDKITKIYFQTGEIGVNGKYTQSLRLDTFRNVDDQATIATAENT